jgi:hypothetical protein
MRQLNDAIPENCNHPDADKQNCSTTRRRIFENIVRERTLMTELALFRIATPHLPDCGQPCRARRGCSSSVRRSESLAAGHALGYVKARLPREAVVRRNF